MSRNPFVGPRPLGKNDPIFGREREISEIYNLLGAERIVLLYSPSGAGKSSMVAAGLIPRLADEFEVWGPARVNLSPPAGMQARNRYVLSAADGFEPEKAKRDVSVLAGMSLKECIATRARSEDAPPSTLLIFDQFEEILRVDPVDTAGKREFFRQVGEVLLDPNIWALFVLREDYLAPLDPYAPLLPTRFKNRYRIDLLEKKKAASAIIQLAPKFSQDAVQELVKDLATVQSQQPDGTFVSETGNYVEPLHLQVVCQRLWSSTVDLPSIGAADVKRAGEVTQALAGYYADAVKDVAKNDLQAEAAIREWVGSKLITLTGIRDQVMRGKDTSEGLPNVLIDGLVDRHLLRQETRAGARWYELAHDRLLLPVQEDNRHWFEQHLTAFQRVARVWDREGRNKDGLLLVGAELNEARAWAKTQAALTEAEQLFLAASERAHAAAEKERLQIAKDRRTRNMAIAAMIVAIGFGVMAFLQMRKAREVARMATANELAAQSRQSLPLYSARALHLAILAYQTAPVPAALSAVHAALLARRTDRILTLGGPVAALSFQGDRLAAVSLDGTFAAWRTTNGEKMQVHLQQPMPNATAAAFNRDGSMVAASDASGKVRVWNALTGVVQYEMMTGQGSIKAIAFSPSNEFVATGADDRSIRIWSRSTPLKTLKKVESSVRALAFKGSGTLIYGTDVDDANTQATVGAWQFQTEPAAKLLATGSYRILGLATSDSGTIAASYGDQGLLINQEHRSSEHQFDVKAIAFQPGSGRFATGGLDGVTKVWDEKSVSITIGERQSPITAVDLSGDGRLVASGGPDGLIHVFPTNKEHAAELMRLENPDDYGSVVRFSPDGRLLAVGLTVSGKVTLWDIETGKMKLAIDAHSSWSTDIHFSRDGKLMLTGGNDGYAKVWNLAAPRKPVFVMELTASLGPVGFSPDGQQMITQDSEGVTSFWVRGNNKPVKTLPLHDRAAGVRGYAYVGADRFLTQSWRTGLLTLWDLNTAKPIPGGEWPNGHDWSSSLSMHPDGKRFITAGADQTVKLWDIESRRSIDLAERAGFAVYSPDGTMFATGGGDGVVRLWNTKTHEMMLELAGHAAMVNHVAFSDDQKLLAAIDNDGYAQVYTLDAERLMNLAKSRLVGTLSRAECEKYLRKSTCPEVR